MKSKLLAILRTLKNPKVLYRTALKTLEGHRNWRVIQSSLFASFLIILLIGSVSAVIVTKPSANQNRPAPVMIEPSQVSEVERVTDPATGQVKAYIRVDREKKKALEAEKAVGSKKAPVTIEVYADVNEPFFQKWFLETYPYIYQNYVETGKVRIEFLHFPLEFKQNYNHNAFRALECAAQQKEFGDYLVYFAKYGYDSKFARLKYYAEETGMDVNKFWKCLTDRASVTYQAAEEKIASDKKLAEKKGITGSPTFFVNGKMINGAQPLGVFKDAILSALQGGREPQRINSAGFHTVYQGDHIDMNGAHAQVKEISWALQGDTNPAVRIEYDYAGVLHLHAGEGGYVNKGPVTQPTKVMYVYVISIEKNEANPLLSSAKVVVIEVNQ